MHAMVLPALGRPLEWQELPDLEPQADEVRVEVLACGVCRTDLHVIDGELNHPTFPIIPGHEIVGRIDALGTGVHNGLKLGDRVGIPWLADTCGCCSFCVHGHENLCDSPQFTGYTRNGGFATAAVAKARYALPLPEAYSHDFLAPLLCAGLIGYRALTKTHSAQQLGIYGFGAAAHIVTQIAKWQGRNVYAFTRQGDVRAQAFARKMGANWTGTSGEMPPVALDAAVIFAPAGELVMQALQALRKGGRVVCAGIHMSNIPSFPYELLWEEREIVSVANLTRQDGLDFLSGVADWGLNVTTSCYPLREANQALADLRAGRYDGAAVLIP